MRNGTLGLCLLVVAASLLSGPPPATSQDFCWGDCPTDRRVVYLGAAPSSEELRRRETVVAAAESERAERQRLEEARTEQIRQNALQQQRDQQRALDQQERADTLAERARAIRRARQLALANPACTSPTRTVSCE